MRPPSPRLPAEEQPPPGPTIDQQWKGAQHNKQHNTTINRMHST